MHVCSKGATWRSLFLMTSTLTRYCFGAPYVCNELAREICAAGAFAHPAFLKESHFRKLKSRKALPRVLSSALHLTPHLCQSHCSCHVPKSTIPLEPKRAMRPWPCSRAIRNLITCNCSQGSSTASPYAVTWTTLMNVGLRQTPILSQFPCLTVVCLTD